ncbi:hypothetical protein [Mycolicibacterium sphagni]|uniref:aromatic-ring hydroxylase C-terminal domain-containing protein n=1 Tax=Mycolicibacterium sphagni TaxID=1786 RepID=UPI003D2FB3DF
MPRRSNGSSCVRSPAHRTAIGPRPGTRATQATPAGRFTLSHPDDGPAVLVRPDGYIAWAGSPEDDGWRAVLATWSPTAEAIHSH